MIVKTQELTKQYGHHRAVSSISMRVRKGAVYGLIGRNGAGKTTFLKMQAGLAAPTKGEIELFGRKGRELGAVPSRIGYFETNRIVRFGKEKDKKFFPWNEAETWHWAGSCGRT